MPRLSANYKIFVDCSPIFKGQSTEPTVIANFGVRCGNSPCYGARVMRLLG